jgi:hypothetical protein
MLSLNCKHVQHVKIYLPCNFEINPITHLEPSIGASHQISAHFGKAVSEKKIFRNQPI